MSTFPIPSFLAPYWQNSFYLKEHLQDFLKLDSQTLENLLKTGKEELAKLGCENFTWEKVTDFYAHEVRDLYLFDLAYWHINSQAYINDNLRLIADNAKGIVLDFGGGIGTHALAAAHCPEVKKVVYCEINPRNIAFVRHRVNQMQLEDKVIFCSKVPDEEQFDTIMSFDVMEHLLKPHHQLLQFHKKLSSEGRMIINWYFSKGVNQEFPFHLDDHQVIDEFFMTLQYNFLEVFHPYHITTRCYRKLIR